MDTLHDYTRDLEHLTSSGAKLILRSERALYNAYGPDAVPRKSTPAMLRGMAAHMLILEGEEKFYKHCHLNPHATKRSKAYKEWVEAEGVDDDFVFNEEDWSNLHRMRDAVRDEGNPAYNALADDLLTSGVAEVTHKWMDAETACPCKSRWDYIRPEWGQLVDLKTTRSAHPRDFGKDVINFGYYLSAEFYRLAYCDKFKEMPEFYWVAVEHDGSHVEVYQPQEAHIERGLDKSREAMKRFMRAKERGFSAGYNLRALGDLEVPSWFQ